jgi:hypothetical protein
MWCVLPATQKLLYRAYHEFGEEKYERLAGWLWRNCMGYERAAATAATTGFAASPTDQRLDSCVP